MISVDEKSDCTVIVLRPNRSLTWRQSKVFVLVVGGFCLSIALVWSFVGAWLVLPFAGLEVGLLALITYVVSRGTYKKQRIFIKKDLVSVQKGIEKIQEEHVFSKEKMSFVCQSRNHPEDVRQLEFRSVNVSCKLGDFLNLDDQNTLIEVLSRHSIYLRELKENITLEM